MLDFKCRRNQGFCCLTVGATIFELTANLFLQRDGNIDTHAAFDRVKY
jgi:hypothetical protein